MESSRANQAHEVPNVLANFLTEKANFQVMVVANNFLSNSDPLALRILEFFDNLTSDPNTYGLQVIDVLRNA